MTFFIYHSKLKRVYFSFFDFHPNVNGYLYFEPDQFKNRKIFFYKDGVLFFELNSKIKSNIKNIFKLLRTITIVFIYSRFFEFLFKFLSAFFFN